MIRPCTAPRCAGRDAAVEYALSNSFGFGGINAAVVLKRHDGV
jgi:3-oxoacyl-(acyl-carrier-protein) synthase